MKKMALAALLALPFITVAAELKEVAADMLERVTPNTITYVGTDGWLYSKNELQHLAAGELVGGRVTEVSKSGKAENADPIAAIKDFNEQLSELGIRLIVVPVPPKLAVDTAGTDGALAPGAALAYLQPFYAELTAVGIEVLELYGGTADPEYYCRTDAHWNPNGIAVAAAALAEALGVEGVTAEKLQLNAQSAEIRGDLLKSLKDDAIPGESVTVYPAAESALSEDASTLLIGDSHCLVFHSGGDMLAEKSGLPDLLARALGEKVDMLAVRGSASTAVRVQLYRKAAKSPEWLTGKKTVIYCFTAREFTESTNGWAKVPVLKK